MEKEIDLMDKKKEEKEFNKLYLTRRRIDEEKEK